MHLARAAATWPMFAASVCFTTAFFISMTRLPLNAARPDSHVRDDLFPHFVYGGSWSTSSSCSSRPSLRVKVPNRQLFHATAISVSATALVVFGLLDLARSRLRVRLDRRLSREQLPKLDRTIRRDGASNRTTGRSSDPGPAAAAILRRSAVRQSGRSVYLREGETQSTHL